MNKEDLAVAAHSEQGDLEEKTKYDDAKSAQLYKDKDDSSKDKAEESYSDAPPKQVPHISGKKPIPRPRLRTQKHKMKEDEDFASSAGPALPPNPDLGIDERGPLHPPESSFDHYMGAVEFRPPTPPAEDDSQRQDRQHTSHRQTDENLNVLPDDSIYDDSVYDGTGSQTLDRFLSRRLPPPIPPQAVTTIVNKPPARVCPKPLPYKPTISTSDVYEEPTYLQPKGIPMKGKTFVDQPKESPEEDLYEDLPDPPVVKSTDDVQVTSTARQNAYGLLPQRKAVELPERPTSTNRPAPLPSVPVGSKPPVKTNKYRPPTPETDQRPIFLDVDGDKEMEMPAPNDNLYEANQDLHSDTPEVAKDKAFTNLLDEHAPITESKKSIFYLLKKASNFPGTNHWKALAQGLEKAKNPFLENNENNESLLTVSSRLGNLDVLKFLLRHGGNLNVHDKRMMYPIHTAAFYGHNILVEHMLNNHININMSGNKGNTPLHYATINKKIATIDYLIRMGANVNARNHAGKKPYDYAKEGKCKQALRLLEDAMIKTVGTSFEKVRMEAENKPVPRMVHEEISRVRQDIEHQAKKIEDIKKVHKKEAEEVKKEIESIKDKAEEQDQKITRIETEYTEVRDTYHNQVMEQFEQMKRHQEAMYEYTYMHNQIPPPIPHTQSGVVLQKGLNNLGPGSFRAEGKSPIPQSQTCPDLTQPTGESDPDVQYDVPDDLKFVTFDVPDRGKLSRDAKTKLQRNYAKIVRNAKIKRIDAELLSEFVIDFDTKSQWRSCYSEREVAEQFVQILMEGTTEQCNKAKEVLTDNNQGDIADLLP